MSAYDLIDASTPEGRLKIAQYEQEQAERDVELGCIPCCFDVITPPCHHGGSECRNRYKCLGFHA